MKLILKKAVGGEETVITENNSIDALKSFAEKKYSLKKAWINSKGIVYDPQNANYCGSSGYRVLRINSKYRCL